MIESKNYNIASSVVIILLTCSVFFISWYAIDVFLLTFAAILLSIFLRSLNNLIQKVIYLHDSLSMSLVLGLVISIFTLMAFFMSPIISEQIHNLSKDIPSALDKVNQILHSTFNLAPLSSLYQMMSENNLLPQGKNILNQATSLFSTTFGFLGSVFVFLIMGIFLAFDPYTYKEGFISLFPPSKQKKIGKIIDSILDILQKWIIVKMFSMVIVGVFTTIGLWLLSIPMALTLGILAAILTFIPNIGPILAAIPAILVAFIQSPISAIYVISLYIAIQALESSIITPLIQKKMISQPPALVIFSQLIMGLLTGFLGLSLATPLLAALSVIIKKAYIENNAHENK